MFIFLAKRVPNRYNTAIDAPETQLNLQLRGTIAAGDETMAHAIIADGNGKDKVYFINDAVPGGAVLHEVYTDRVILNRAGILETLRLPRVSKATWQSANGQARRLNCSDQNPISPVTLCSK